MNYIIWGGTGQAKVVRPILAGQGHSLVGVFDNDPKIEPPFADRPLLGDNDAFEHWRYSKACGFVVAIGGANGRVRCEIAGKLAGAGLEPLHAIHDYAFVANSAKVGVGSQIMAMAAICEDAWLGDYCIVNTGATIDHECHIGRGVHIMPGATLCGCVKVGDYATIGSGATILPRIKIGEGAMVGAGAVVTKDVRPGATVVGVPARERDVKWPRVTLTGGSR